MHAIPEIITFAPGLKLSSLLPPGTGKRLPNFQESQNRQSFFIHIAGFNSKKPISG
jgi:hypothetical protein